MGQSPPGSTYNEHGDGLPFFQGARDFTRRHPTPRVYCSVPTRIAKCGDLLLSVRAPIGRINVANRECGIGRGLSIIRPNSHDDARYVEFALKSRVSQWQVLEETGSVFGNATKKNLIEFQIPWPDATTRCAIARILGTLDDKIELNRRMNETLEAMAQAIFKDWFVDFGPVRAKMEGRDTGLPKDIADLFPDRMVDSELGEIPEGWEVRTLGDLCRKPRYGYTASAQQDPVGPKFLRITDINKVPWVSWSRVPYCRTTNDEFTKYRLWRRDILIARMADPGHGIMVEEDMEAVFASYLIRFRPTTNRIARLLQYWLKSDPYWHLVRGRATGTTRRSINAKVLGLFQLVVPPDALAHSFSEMVGKLRDRLIASVREMESLAALRDTLLPKLISGEIQIDGAEGLVATGA